MSDFVELIKDALSGGEPFEPEPGRLALEEAMRRYDRRARVMRWITAIALVFMTVVAGWGLSQIVHSSPENTRMISHGVMLTTFGFVGIGFMKLWFLLSQNHLMLMRELKGLEYLILRGDERK